MSSAAEAHYPIETRKGEIERLAMQADAIAPDARVLLDRIGVATGWRCLDLGCGRHFRQSARTRVGLGAGGGDVDLVAVEHRLRGGEAFVLDWLGAQARRQRGGVADDDEIDVGASASQQQVAHGTPDEINGFATRRVAHRVELRVRGAQRLAQLVDRQQRRHVEGPYARTGMPAASRWRFASRTR